MTYLLDDLVEAGLVERRPNPEDRRQRLVVATPQGKQAIEQLCQDVTTAERGLLADLTDDEQTTLRRLLVRAACAASVSQDVACEEVASSLS
jgi:DNA-binding MarR family transcriptional regulator